MSGGLREQAQLDLKMTIQGEFGQKIKLSKPNNSEYKDFIGNSNDVAVAIDPQTGDFITGKTCQAVFILSEVLNHFGVIPDNLWMVEFLEISPAKLRIKDVRPDSTQGILILIVGK